MKKIFTVLLGVIAITNTTIAQSDFKPFVNQITEYIDSDTSLKIWKTNHVDIDPSSESSNIIKIIYNSAMQCVRMENLILKSEIEIQIKYYFFNGLPIKITLQESTLKKETSKNATIVYRKNFYVSNWKNEEFITEEQGISKYSSEYILGLFDYEAYMLEFYMDPEK